MKDKERWMNGEKAWGKKGKTADRMAEILILAALRKLANKEPVYLSMEEILVMKEGVATFDLKIYGVKGTNGENAGFYVDVEGTNPDPRQNASSS